jgi:hypothetical protein
MIIICLTLPGVNEVKTSDELANFLMQIGNTLHVVLLETEKRPLSPSTATATSRTMGSHETLAGSSKPCLAQRLD